jgi:hypothetical protein
MRIIIQSVILFDVVIRRLAVFSLTFGVIGFASSSQLVCMPSVAF